MADQQSAWVCKALEESEHHSGYCSYGCVIKNGWAEEIVICHLIGQAKTTWKPEYAVCDAPRCCQLR